MTVDKTTAVPLACNLDAQSLAGRLRRIVDLAQRHLQSVRQEGLTLQLRYASEAAHELRDIVALERQCCALLSFELQEAPNAIDLTISAPAEAGESASALYEHFRGVALAPSSTRCAGGGCGCTV